MHDVLIRPIKPQDDAALAKIIRAGFKEFGVCGPGSSEQDAHVDLMHDAYGRPMSAYFVAVKDDEIIGGGGIAPLAGGDGQTCELQKMFLAPAMRGFGVGRRLLETCLEKARGLGYSRCYLETRSTMHDAHRLYRAAGFVDCATPMGSTGHWTCEMWLVKEL